METPTIGKPTGIAVGTALVLLVVGYLFYPDDPVLQFSIWITIFTIYLTWFVVFFTDWIYEIE
jgi:hypothetical protein